MSNTLNPIYSFATVCHQVRCMYWRHFSVFHRAMSLSNGLIGRFIIHIYSHVFEIWDAQAFSLEIYCSFNIETYCLYVCVYIKDAPKLWRKYPETKVYVQKHITPCTVVINSRLVRDKPLGAPASVKRIYSSNGLVLLGNQLSLESMLNKTTPYDQANNQAASRVQSTSEKLGSLPWIS